MNRFALCLATAALCAGASNARAQGLVFHDDFESGASNWTFTGPWHVETDSSTCGALTAPFPSPGHCAWFGAQHSHPGVVVCDYDLGIQPFGELRLSTPVVLPANTGSIALRYRRFLQTEFCAEAYDVSVVYLSFDFGSTWVLAASDCGEEPGWADRRVDLSANGGQSVLVGFRFDSGDGSFNDGLGWWIDDVEIAAEPGVVGCQASAACPCPGQTIGYAHFLPSENTGGCKHSAAKEARLFGNGSQSVANDSVELVLHDAPQSTVALYVQGTSAAQSTFGDGRLCTGGPFVRLAMHHVSGGQDVYPRAGEAGIALRGSIPAGGATRTYQIVYRDAAAYCTSSTFNTSNGYLITWRP